ncbi:MAG: 16S rRNA (uracil(1498)-N(3))-methyltransferase, partial [Clostridiales bacterium]|nr:16S rRNA (uracil(1498)-N(3))-methyltransferase [Clostridiales bacterium]
MNRFFVLPSAIDLEGKEIIIDNEDVKHISKVLRLSTGDLVEISDGEKYEYIAEIKDISKENVLLSIVDKKPFFTEPQMEINLYQSVPKGSKMEFVIQKTTELGINSIIPVLTERTIVQFKNDKDKKVERWKKIAEEASKQSKRGIIPQIINPMSF